jgi:hypothetical protein
MAEVSTKFLALLELDVVSTLGEKCRHFVSDAAEGASSLDIHDPSHKVAEDVQQRVHDESIDTVWPGCPKHSDHPLWYDAGGWWCERDRVQIAPLGRLRSVSASARRFEGISQGDLEELQQRWSAEDDREKVSNRATARLAELYRSLDGADRAVFDRVLADWLHADDPGKRFDAQALIREFKICSALPALRQSLAYWRNRLARYPGVTKSGEHGLERSHALAAVQVLDPLIQELEHKC